MEAEGINGLVCILTKFFKAETHLRIKCFEACATCVAKADVSALCHSLQSSLGLGGEGSGDTEEIEQGHQSPGLLVDFFVCFVLC